MALAIDANDSITPFGNNTNTKNTDLGIIEKYDQPDNAQMKRDPSISMADCNRIVIIGRTGSGKTTLARQLAAALGVPHVELDSLYFGPDFSTVPLDVLRERTVQAIAGERWVTDGNKSAVRDLVWPRADTIVWLDYSLAISLWRLGKRALWRTSVLKSQTSENGKKTGLLKKMMAGARGVFTALRSHMGQRRLYPILFSLPENQHLAVIRLNSPKSAQRWLNKVAGNVG